MSAKALSVIHEYLLLCKQHTSTAKSHSLVLRIWSPPFDWAASKVDWSAADDARNDENADANAMTGCTVFRADERQDVNLRIEVEGGR